MMPRPRPTIPHPTNLHAACIRLAGYTFSNQLRVLRIFTRSALDAPGMQMRTLRAAAAGSGARMHPAGTTPPSNHDRQPKPSASPEVAGPAPAPVAATPAAAAAAAAAVPATVTAPARKSARTPSAPPMMPAPKPRP